MNRVFTYLGRFAVIVIGYIAGSLAASAFLHLLLLGASGFSVDTMPGVVAGSLAFSIPFAALIIANFAFLPAMPIVFVAEMFALRSWLFHVLAGGMVGLAVAVLLRTQGLNRGDATAEATAAEPRLIALVVGAGLVGGLVYWLAAGRFSGNWRDRLGASISPGRSES